MQQMQKSSTRGSFFIGFLLSSNTTRVSGRWMTWEPPLNSSSTQSLNSSKIANHSFEFISFAFNLFVLIHSIHLSDWLWQRSQDQQTIQHFVIRSQSCCRGCCVLHLQHLLMQQPHCHLKLVKIGLHGIPLISLFGVKVRVWNKANEESTDWSLGHTFY